VRPLIGISAHQATVKDGELEVVHHVASIAYVKAVRKAGGVPVLLPLVEPDDAEMLLERIDGFLVTGGADVDPANYGAEPDPMTIRTDPVRDATDIALCRLAVDRDVPTLAICRGVQVLNVALGGTLVQHVPDHFDVPNYNETVHKVTVEPDSVLAEWVGATDVGVNTLHHQAIDEVAGPLRRVAIADDGTTEGVESSTSRRVVGVQWHPELLRHRPEHLALFESLVRMASDARVPG
jgi:putative glutamine amidotransferase